MNEPIVTVVESWSVAECAFIVIAAGCLARSPQKRSLVIDKSYIDFSLPDKPEFYYHFWENGTKQGGDIFKAAELEYHLRLLSRLCCMDMSHILPHAPFTLGIPDCSSGCTHFDVFDKICADRSSMTVSVTFSKAFHSRFLNIRVQPYLKQILSECLFKALYMDLSRMSSLDKGLLLLILDRKIYPGCEMPVFVPAKLLISTVCQDTAGSGVPYSFLVNNVRQALLHLMHSSEMHYSDPDDPTRWSDGGFIFQFEFDDDDKAFYIGTYDYRLRDLCRDYSLVYYLNHGTVDMAGTFDMI